ncbi:MAG: hypothetical protein R2854_09890 [Caldilineaceae bacterium]
MGAILLYIGWLFLRNPVLVKIGLRNIPEQPVDPHRARPDVEHRDHRQFAGRGRHAQLLHSPPGRGRARRDRRDLAPPSFRSSPRWPAATVRPRKPAMRRPNWSG